MPTCDNGWTLDSIPSTPDPVFRTNPPNQWERVQYVWEPANNCSRSVMGCGQTGQFNYYFELGESATIEVGFSEKIGVSGGVSYSATQGNGNAVNVGGPGYEYMGTPIVLKMTRESGTYETSGGFGIGWWTALWRFFWHGPAGLLPRMEFKTEKTEEIYLRCGWMICKRPCG
jgi:hypothetical protein